MCFAWSVLYDMSLCLFCFVSYMFSPWRTHLFEKAKKICYACSYASLKFLEPWICSSTSLIYFLARCALLFLKKCSLASLRSIWELVKFLKTFSLASLKFFWEKENLLCSWSSLIFVWAYEKQHMKISPKVIESKKDKEKKCHEDLWTK